MPEIAFGRGDSCERRPCGCAEEDGEAKEGAHANHSSAVVMCGRQSCGSRLSAGWNRWKRFRGLKGPPHLTLIWSEANMSSCDMSDRERIRGRSASRSS